jgi:hypothetical protein
MACHGELARSKPPVERLTLFYLCVSAGGALGGLFCTTVATQLFTKYWELHIGLAACVVLALAAYSRAPKSELAKGRHAWASAPLPSRAPRGSLVFRVGCGISAGFDG